MKTLLTSLTLALCFFSCTSSKINSPSKTACFKVEIIQNGKVVKKKDNVITLKKAPFVYQLTFYNTTDVDLSHSWDKYYYDYPSNENIYKCEDRSYFEGCRFAAPKTGTEDRFNVKKDIYVGDDTYQFNWFYEKDLDWHRMDKGVTVKDGVIHAQVTVENIYDLDKRDTEEYKKTEYNYPIEKINQDIYVVFAAGYYKSGMEMPNEIQREKFILKFK